MQAVPADDVGRMRRRTPLRYASLTSLFTGAKFPYFSKGKPDSSWLISKSSDIFLYKSSKYKIPLIRDQNFVSSLHVRHLSRYADILRHPLEQLAHMTVSGSETTKVFITWNMDIFLIKCMDSLQAGFIHHPEPCEADFILDAHTLFTSSGLLTNSTSFPKL